MERMWKKMFVVFMSFVLILTFALPSNASAKTISNDYGMDLFINQKSETVFIEGISYTYDYSYENNYRIVYVTNNDDNSVEKVSYNINTSTIYHNDQAIGSAKQGNNIEFQNPTYSINSDFTWVTVDSASHYISWAAGVTVAVLAGIIALVIPQVGAALITSKIGFTALAILAGSSGGGTVRYTLQRMTIPYNPPLHRYLWSFTASTGDYYGEYVHHL